LYVIGGETTNNQALSSCEKLVHGYWVPINPMRKARSRFGATIFEDKLIVAGGFNREENMLASAEILDLVTGVWTDIEPMNSPSVDLSLCFLPQELIL